MTNTTKNTTKSIFLALSVALSMGVASAASVPGIPTDTFEFNQIGSNDTPTTGHGFNAIANVNAILGSLANTGGSTIDTDNYWKSFVKPAKEQTFDYVTAKPMIEELVFTVNGEAHGTVYEDDGYGNFTVANVGWHDAGDISTPLFDNNDNVINGSFSTAKKDMLARTSQYVSNYTVAETEEAAGFTLGSDFDDSGTIRAATQADLNSAAGFDAGAVRMVADGKIAASGEAAAHLLKRIGFTNVDTPLGNHQITYATDNSSADVVLDTYPSEYVSPLNTTEVKRKLINTVLAAANTAPGSYIDDQGATVTGQSFNTTFTADAAAARVDAVAFANANQLIGLIAQQLKNGYLLDVVKATAAVDGIIEHHNNFLAASIVDEAKKLKDVMKNIGLQSAAVTVGKTTASVCGDNGQNSIAANCVRIGTAFKDIALDINGIVSNDVNGTIVTSAASVTEYNSAIDAITVFAGNLSDFNTAEVSAYNANDSKDAIYGQFGDIMVIDNTEIDNALDATNGTNPYTVARWTDETAFEITDSGFDGMFDLDGDSNTTDDLVELH